MELLREIAPRVTRAAVLRDPAIASGIGQYAVIQAVAPSFGSNGGLIVTPSTLAAGHRELIITLAARHRLPAVYSFRYYATGRHNLLDYRMG